MARVTLPDGTVILACGRLDLVPSVRPRDPDFAIYLDARWADDPQVIWPFRVVGWEDFGLDAGADRLYEVIADGSASGLDPRARAGRS